MNNKAAYKDLSDKIFDKRYNSPNPLRRYVHRAQYDSVLNQVNSSESVIDVGCGEGVLSCLLAQKGARVTGVDISEPNIRAAKELARRMGVEERVTFLVGDAENVDFPDKSFDTVVSCHVLEHLPDFDKGLSEVFRMSKNKVIIALPTMLNLCSIIQVGHGSFWELSKRSVAAIPWGIARSIFNLFDEGVNEGYMGRKELVHIFRWPWVVRARLKNNDFKITHFEASTISLPYFNFFLCIMKFLDRYKDKIVLRNFGYGTTTVSHRETG